MAWAAHDGLARALYPAHTAIDGDLVFAAATGARDGDVSVSVSVSEQIAIGHAAAICLARAVARGVFAATSAPGDVFPTWSEIK